MELYGGATYRRARFGDRTVAAQNLRRNICGAKILLKNGSGFDATCAASHAAHISKMRRGFDAK